MPVDLRIALPNRPGVFLKTCQALSDRGLTIEGICGDLRPGETWGYVHVLVDDAYAARAALEAVGAEVLQEHDVDILQLEPGPGSLLDAIRTYSDEGRNVEVIYSTSGSRVVVGTEDMRRQRPGLRVDDVP